MLSLLVPMLLVPMLLVLHSPVLLQATTTLESRFRCAHSQSEAPRNDRSTIPICHPSDWILRATLPDLPALANEYTLPLTLQASYLQPTFSSGDNTRQNYLDLDQLEEAEWASAECNLVNEIRKSASPK